MKANVFASSRSAPVFTGAAAAYIGLAFVLGGASQANDLFDLIVRLAAIPLMGWSLFRLAEQPETPRASFLLLVLLAALPVVQLIPLPPGVWEALPERSLLAADLAAAGVPPVWRPLSLTPGATLDALVGLIPFAAVLLAALSLSPKDRRRLWVFAGFAALISVAVGAVQVAAGTSGAFRLYEGHGRAASGFFANRNHWAAWLAASIPVLAWLFRYGGASDRPAPPMMAALLAAVFLAVLTGVAISGSRAGAVLAALAVVGSLVLLGGQGSKRTLVLSAVVAMAGAVIAIAGAWAAAERFGASSEDLRFDIWADSIRLALAHLPFGAGGGSFSAVYVGQESPDRLTTAFVNQAHNDWIEVFVEYGLMALAPMAVAAAFVVKGARRTDAAGRFMLLALVILMAASVVDYPLRTPALQAFVALLLAGLVARDPGPRRRRRGELRA